MSWTHFEQMAEDYDSARPPYPQAVFEVLKDQRVIGPGLKVLEVGAGTGLATRELVSSGSHVVALEPGRGLGQPAQASRTQRVGVQSRSEDASLPDATFDSVVAATSMHWIDLSIGLPRLHRSIRRGGSLAVFRSFFGDAGVDTEFRDRVRQIVARREDADVTGPPPEPRPTMCARARR